MILSLDHRSTNIKLAFCLSKNCNTEEYPKGNDHLTWSHFIYEYSPRSLPSLLALKKLFENKRVKSAANDPEVWITKPDVIGNQMDEIDLLSCMSDDDFMLHIIGNLSEEYEAVLTDLENRLMAESGKNSLLNL